MQEYIRRYTMELIRKLLRKLLGVNASNFNEAQEAAVAELLAAQLDARAVYSKDTQSVIDANVALVQLLAVKIAEQEAELKILNGGK